MFNKIRALKQAFKTITSTKPKTTTRKSNLIKGANKRIKDLEKAVKSQTDLMNVAKQNKNIDRKDIVPVAKNIREGKKIIREVEGVKKDIYKRDFKKGGRIGFKKGTGRSGVPAMDIKSTPTKKLSEKQKRIAKLAGDPRKIDKPDFAKLRNKNKKVI